MQQQGMPALVLFPSGARSIHVPIPRSSPFLVCNGRAVLGLGTSKHKPPLRVSFLFVVLITNYYSYAIIDAALVPIQWTYTVGDEEETVARRKPDRSSSHWRRQSGSWQSLLYFGRFRRGRVLTSIQTAAPRLQDYVRSQIPDEQWYVSR